MIKLLIWEFPWIYGNSREFLGIPVDLWEFPMGFPEFWLRKVNVVAPKLG